jgi:hypothetical protein
MRIIAKWQCAAVLMTSAVLLQFGGCNPTLQSTVESGIIDTSTSLITSFFRALINVASENAA